MILKGNGMKQNIKIIIETMNKIFLLKSSSVLSFNGGGCIMPVKKIIINAKKVQPENIIIIMAIQAAYFCLSPRIALKICPPSS